MRLALTVTVFLIRRAEDCLFMTATIADLSSLKQDITQEARSAIREAIGFHQAAVRLWAEKVTGNKVTSPSSLDLYFPGTAALFEKCPDTQLPVKNLIAIDATALRRRLRRSWKPSAPACGLVPTAPG